MAKACTAWDCLIALENSQKRLFSEVSINLITKNPKIFYKSIIINSILVARVVRMVQCEQIH